MKQQLKQHTQLLRTADMPINLDFEAFIHKSMEILDSYECSFRYLRSDSKRNGHIKANVNRRTGEYTLELAINRFDNVGGQVYTIIHELTHLINNHMFSRELSKKQAEVVADTTALYFINKFNLLAEYKTSDVASKWNVETYSDMYIDNMQLSKQRYDLIIRQINDSKIIIQKLYI
ncbi:hypothetical protein RZE82_08375 [Mollicutes bacterium LVI A0039]|nr:hypothetical protein RZE82_08375 [Mollicutes bacterium LVI A0039]